MNDWTALNLRHRNGPVNKVIFFVKILDFHPIELKAYPRKTSTSIDRETYPHAKP